ncbi:hypothetical protein EHO66_00680 [Leptospira kmetyi]|uniref:hypothetical protein n=1 Tax=Leptospira kmetyi TaxID=408139 RepID=UPI001084394B|nr:hypothetical protein [Leptospira kmetyi]TGK34424.1 hypothetical protein EHO66_00680 [Leptospira kmetyi]
MKAKRPISLEFLSTLLYDHDPLGLTALRCPEDEYDPEAETILDRLEECHDSLSLQIVIHQEFIRWFGEEAAGPLENYEDLAMDLWNQLQN